MGSVACSRARSVSLHMYELDILVSGWLSTLAVGLYR